MATMGTFWPFGDIQGLLRHNKTFLTWNRKTLWTSKLWLLNFLPDPSEIWTQSCLRVRIYVNALSYPVFGSWKNPHKFSKNPQKSTKIHVSARLLGKIRVSQVFLDPIQNSVSARSVHLRLCIAWTCCISLSRTTNNATFKCYNPRVSWYILIFTWRFVYYKGYA